MLVDTHCHLDASEFSADRARMLQASREAGVDAFVVPAIGVAHFDGVHRLVAENDDIDPDDPDDPADPFDINSRITFNLQPGASYFILANSFDPEVTGDYMLKVQAVSAFIAPRSLRAKPGKAPIETLLKALKTGKPR